MSEPAIKGSAIQTLVMVLNELRASGRVTPELIEAHLDDESRALLESAVGTALWVPLPIYERLVALLYAADAEGRSRADYFHWRGESVARRLCDQGLYQQLASASDDDAAGGGGLSRLQVRLTLSIWDALLNFTQWKWSPDPEDPCALHIAVLNSQAVPEPLRHQIRGFLGYVLGRLAGEPVRVAMDERQGAPLRYDVLLAKPLA